jgi:hypothetical protein
MAQADVKLTLMVLSIDPNPYEVTEPELLLLRKLGVTVAFAFTDGEHRRRRQTACSNLVRDAELPR